jgi:hypothetical protein
MRVKPTTCLTCADLVALVISSITSDAQNTESARLDLWSSRRTHHISWHRLRDDPPVGRPACRLSRCTPPAMPCVSLSSCGWRT